ncbi:MAG: hemerythrin domain-containing protein [Hymenobacteraceae bacterium]|nr:hemerythrin domain-containing protein [Hymenobacteraceae bacterium]MDX5395689.1 hemerythrin domain-containing protein [Hymenobacteraceae bacterium]MDX5511743.1 hemerythrin domain-containing protein [Hymenobacteraceae bacterium]
MTERKPLKRDPALAPLSRQHHQGLLLARLLRKDAPAYKGLPTDPEGKKAYLLQFFENELKPHFLLEEQKLFPAVQQFTPELNNLTDQLLHEHRQMEQMVSYIEKTNGADPLQLHELGLMLEKHIRTE